MLALLLLLALPAAAEIPEPVGVVIGNRAYDIAGGSCDMVVSRSRRKVGVLRRVKGPVSLDAEFVHEDENGACLAKARRTRGKGYDGAIVVTSCGGAFLARIEEDYGWAPGRPSYAVSVGGTVLRSRVEGDMIQIGDAAVVAEVGGSWAVVTLSSDVPDSVFLFMAASTNALVIDFIRRGGWDGDPCN